MSEAPDSIPPMVHAVAEALRAACLKEYGSNWNYDVSWAFARAAIGAMREPTREMVKAAARHDGTRAEIEAAATWEIMADAALAEPSTPR